MDSTDTPTTGAPASAPPADGPPRPEGAPDRPSRLAGALLTTRGPRLREFVVMFVLLSALAALAYADRVLHAGFVTDDWSLRKVYLIWTEGDRGLDDFVLHAGFAARPALGVYLGLVQGAFDFHQGMYLGLAVGMAVLLSLSVYLLLRTLRFEPLHAGVIAALLLLFPGSGSTRLWAVMGDSSWTLLLLVLGAVLTLRSFDARGRRRAWLRAGGLVLYALSISTYEIGTLVLACSVVLYRCRVRWRPALIAWAQDLAVIAVVYLLALRHSPSQRLPLSDTLDHGWEIVRGAFELFGTVAVPFIDADVPVIVAALAILGAAAVAWRRLPAGDVRSELERWLVTVGVACVVIVAGYAIFAPGLRIYVPMAPALENRMNALPGIGLVIVVYALGALAATLAFRRLANRRAVTAAVTAAFGVLVLAFYLSDTRDDVARWNRAYFRGQQTLNLMLQKMPKPPPDSMVISFGQPVWEGESVPVWATTWDLDGAVALRYGDVSLAARPAFPGTTITCGEDSAGPANATLAAYPPNDVRPYGKLYLFSAWDGTWAAPRNRRECERVAPRFVPGPWEASAP